MIGFMILLLSLKTLTTYNFSSSEKYITLDE